MFSQHYRKSFHNEGVHVGLEEIKGQSIGPLINTWAQSLADIPDTHHAIFEGVRRDGNSPNGYFRYGGLMDFKLEGASDKRWTDRPSNVRHRVVDFTVDCNIQAFRYKDPVEKIESTVGRESQAEKKFRETLEGAVQEG